MSLEYEQKTLIKIEFSTDMSYIVNLNIGSRFSILSRNFYVVYRKKVKLAHHHQIINKASDLGPIKNTLAVVKYMCELGSNSRYYVRLLYKVYRLL